MPVFKLVRASISRNGGQWSDDDYDVYVDGVVCGRICNACNYAPSARWFWGIEFHKRARLKSYYGHAESCEAAAAAFTRTWLNIRSPSTPG